MFYYHIYKEKYKYIILKIQSLLLTSKIKYMQLFVIRAINATAVKGSKKHNTLLTNIFLATERCLSFDWSRMHGKKLCWKNIEENQEMYCSQNHPCTKFRVIKHQWIWLKVIILFYHSQQVIVNDHLYPKGFRIACVCFQVW